MAIINMLDDFRVLVEESKQIGKWDAFKAYYGKYTKLWDSIVAYLYMINLEGLEPTIETIDFEQLLLQVEKNRHQIDEIISLVQKAVEDLGFTEEYDLYIGAGLGHVNGTSLLGDKPIIYFGIECIGDSDMEYLVPHQVSHMIRGFYTKSINSNAFEERVITEGIGTIYPILFNKCPIDVEHMAKALIMPRDTVERLLAQEVDLTREVFKKMEFTITPELMRKFFVYNPTEKEETLTGYFIGMRIIERLVEKGVTIQKIITLSADKIISKYQETL